jgi:tRNA-dihydrouridine synthase
LIKFGKWLEKAWAKLMTVHWRTAKQAYTWTADWTQIYKLKEELKIPVVWNWDVQNYEDWMKKVKNLDWFMIGRASFGNPWCFIWEKHSLEYSHLKKENFVNWAYHPSLLEILEIMEFHAEKLVETKGEKKWNLEIRKHLVQYLKNFPWVKKYRKRLVTTESFENTKKILEEIKIDFKDFLNKRPGLGEISKDHLNIN